MYLFALDLKKCNVIYELFCWQISKDEGIKTDLSTLIALCEKADNDIRSCINTLQVKEFVIVISFIVTFLAGDSEQ